MRKKRILFIGHFLPEANKDALINYFFCKSIKSDMDVELVLLSDSWCRIRDKSDVFGTYDEMIDNSIFDEKYYVDPVQVRSELDMYIGLKALYKKVTRKIIFDKIVISNYYDYYLLCDAMINNERIVLLNYSFCANSIQNDYSFELMLDIHKKSEMLITSEKGLHYYKTQKIYEGKKHAYAIKLNKSKNAHGKAAIVAVGTRVLIQDIHLSKLPTTYIIRFYSIGNAELIMDTTKNVDVEEIVNLKSVEELNSIFSDNEIVVDASELCSEQSVDSSYLLWGAIRIT